MSAFSEFDRARLRAISIAMLVVAVASVALLVWREFEVRDEVYGRIVQDRGAAAAREFDGFFSPVQVQLEAFRTWGESGDLDLGSPEAMDARFIPLLTPQAWAEELSIAGEGSFGYRIMRSESGWVRDPDPVALKRSSWYGDAVTDETGGQHWAASAEPDDPVALHASASWTEDETGLVRVIALGVSASALDSLIAAFPVTEQGTMALLQDDGDASWYTPEEGTTFNPTDAAQLLHPTNEGERRLSRAIHAWTEAGAVDNQPFTFRHGGQRWWGWRGPLEVGRGTRDLLMVLPSSDLSDRLVTVTSPLTYALLALFGVCVFVLFRVALGYRGRIVRMSGAAIHSDSTEEELQALIGSGESDQLEFKSTLRWNLRQNEPGREIELAWLKTVVAFLNTDGGTLLIGVADNGDIVGTAKDGFRNDDKYLLHVNNLLQRHIGIEFIRYLRYGLKPVGDRHILVLDVLPADEPAFLRVDDDDQFYVRMGPASKKLSVRKTFEYLKDVEGR